MQIPKLQTIFILRNSISLSSSSCQYVYFHSTPPSFAKWKNKWDSDADRCKPSKSYARYAIRQKRADAKKALKDFVLNSCSKLPFQDAFSTWHTDQTSSWDVDEADFLHGSRKKSRSKKSRRSSRTGKGKPRWENFYADFEEHPETIFREAFGNKSYSWSFLRWWEEPSFQSASAEFEWRKQSNWSRDRRREWDSTSETDEDEKKSNWTRDRRRVWYSTSESDKDEKKSCNIGSSSDRKILGLPLTGPLKIEDVKSAFRSCALKWHPDKHQGPSQAVAEETFKNCVDAYETLCNALSSA
ncbi:Chaperone dnaj-domain superfamily protein [Thalictrum thalictroides]|uniref:Chaperone dnaj-domain superfamily protein n=1 Tax=Thalictrum thalictroides TaxID=46969 RepID=A0A7J6VYA1_THATH|nr:Chaperone dnaj-domain superfamily protein [Thalictrum thalictroides]